MVGKCISVVAPGVQGTKVNSRGKEMAHGTRLYSIAATRYGDTLDGKTTTLCVRRVRPARQPLAGKPPAGKDSAVWWSSHPLHPPHVAPLFAVGWQCPGSAQRVRRRPRCKQSCSLRPGYLWSGARGLGAGARGLEGRREEQSSTCKLPQEQSIPLQPPQPPRSTVGQLAGGPVPRCACMDFLSPRGPEDTGIKVSERCRGCAGDVLGRGEGRG